MNYETTSYSEVGGRNSKQNRAYCFRITLAKEQYGRKTPSKPGRVVEVTSKS